MVFRVMVTITIILGVMVISVTPILVGTEMSIVGALPNVDVPAPRGRAAGECRRPAL